MLKYISTHNLTVIMCPFREEIESITDTFKPNIAVNVIYIEPSAMHWCVLLFKEDNMITYKEEKQGQM